MSTLTHESPDQSPAANQLVRDLQEGAALAPVASPRLWDLAEQQRALLDLDAGELSPEDQEWLALAIRDMALQSVHETLMPQPPYLCDGPASCASKADMTSALGIYRQSGKVLFLAAYSVDAASLNPTFPEGAVFEYFCGPGHLIARISDLLGPSIPNKGEKQIGKG